MFFGIGVTVLIIFGGVFYFLMPKEDIKPTENKPAIVAEKTPSKTTKTYVDEAGFQFEYPDDVTVTGKKELNDQTYADVTISSDLEGEIQLVVTDTKIKSLKDWLTQNKISSDSAKIETIPFGGIDALEVNTDSKKITVALDKGVLFVLEGTLSKEKSYWDLVYKTIQSSFLFVSSNPATSQSSGTESSVEDAVLEEEVIE